MANEKMFCFQCEQTAGCKGCTGNAGVCGKTAEVAAAQDALTGALIGLAATVEGCASCAEARTAATDLLVCEGLFATLTNVDFDGGHLAGLTERVHAETARIAADGCTAAADFDMAGLWADDEDGRSLKTLVLLGVRGVAAYAYHARVLGYTDPTVDAFLYRALAALPQPGSVEGLLPLAMEVGAVNLAAMALLDRANTTAFGTPEPTEVTYEVEPGPFIVVSGHDLHDLQQLLEATQGRGVNVYTHGEMLPAHAYPELKKYAHLKGNFGTAWQNQQKEFAGVPAAFLFTTNCLMTPKPTYADRVFTTACVAHPGLARIEADEQGRKDFSAVIEKALELGGYAEAQRFAGINGGDHVTTGFAQGAVLANAGAIVDAVKAGQISHFFLVAGCDGARPGRNYYTDFVKATPADSIVLTLACGKYRFNDLDLGTVAGFPRILDMGQCNDAYSAIQVAVALAGAFECGVNDLPLSFVISWYEQKAVAILLTLLHLGIKDIVLGPTLPAFLSPNIAAFLVENFGIAPITTPEADMARLLGK